MNTESEVQEVAVPSDTSSIPPPLWHIVAHHALAKPGDVALCGAKMVGIDGGSLDNLRGVCEKCAKLWQGRV